MTALWRAPTIRARLTGWYAAVLTLMMLVYAAITFVSVRHEFEEQFDHRLHADLEGAEERLTRTADGRVVWAIAPRSGEQADEARVYEVWSVAGEPLHRSGAAVALPPLGKFAGSPLSYDRLVIDGQSWRMLAAPVSIGGYPVVLRLSQSEERLRGELREILVVLVLGLPMVVGLAAIGGYLLARRALTPIDHLASEAKRITAARLHERLTARHPTDEIGRLTTVINDTLARLEASFEQLRRFTADASHELRTPLAVVRSIGEAAVAERRTPDDYEEAVGSMLEEVDRMTSLVDTLLRLSHADAGTIRLSREPLDLGQLARDVASSMSVLAEERSQSIAFEIVDGIVAPVDRAIFREALRNVLDNAIKYSPVGSTILVRVARAGESGALTVVDEGPGIAPEHRDRIFDRFFRVDEGRARDGGGAGLGLAIAKWAVELNGGRIMVADHPGPGAEFRIVLPCQSVSGHVTTA